MLQQHLEDKSDKRGDMLNELWRGKTSSLLTPDQCLAVRVDTLQSKANYKATYDFLGEQLCFNVYQPPSVVSNCEFKYMPASSFSVQNNISEFEHFSYECPENNQSPSQFEPINITESFPTSIPELASPNCVGVRWSYPQAIAMAELDVFVSDKLKSINVDPFEPSILIKTTIKDGCDGLGDTPIYWEASNRFLPDKAFRYAFCVLEMKALVQGQEIMFFQEEKPNFIRSNRPLLEAIADENNKASCVVCKHPVDLEGKVLNVKTECGMIRRHELKFLSSMRDEKLDRSAGGLISSGSNFLCTLCHADRESALTNLGSFKITRTKEEAVKLAKYFKINPENLSDSKPG